MTTQKKSVGSVLRRLQPRGLRGLASTTVTSEALRVSWKTNRELNSKSWLDPRKLEEPITD